MKIIHAFVLIMLTFVAKADYTPTKCEDYASSLLNPNYGNQSAFSLDFCRTTYFDTTKYAKCCFLKWEDSLERRHYNCVPVTPYNYSDIDRFEDEIEVKLGEDAIDSIDCKSSYLYGSIFLILALLF